MVGFAIVEAHVEEELKAEAEKILAQEGLTVSDALRLMLVATVEERTLPARYFRPNAETRDALTALDRGEYKTFNTVEELMADLNADD